MAQTGQTTATALNLRTQSNADIGSTIIESLPLGTIVQILTTVVGGQYQTSSGTNQNDWYQVKVNGKQGFVAAAFVTSSTLQEIRGVWIADHSNSPVLTSKVEIAKALEFLQTNGFNTVFPAVWNRGFTAFPSDVMVGHGFPKQDPFYAGIGFDPLQEIVTQAKARNMAVIPWFEYGFAASPAADGGHILQNKPQWAAINKDGDKVVHGTLTWMNSLNSEVQQFILDLILEVIRNYPNIDGIQGDDRLPALPFTGGYDSGTKDEFGTKPPTNGQDDTWVKFRANILTQFLRRLFNEVKNTNPNTIVSITPAAFPFCLNNLMQDSNTWVKENIVDFIHPQLYRESFNGGTITIDGGTRQLSRYKPEVDKIKSDFKTADKRAKFAPGIAFKANNINLTKADILECVKLNRNSGFRGQVFFFYEGLRKNNDEMAIALKTHGGYDQIASLPSPPFT